MQNNTKGHLFNMASVFALALGPLLSKFGLIHISPGFAALINALTIIISSYLFGFFKKQKVTFYLKKKILLLGFFNSIGVIFLFLSISFLSPVEIGFIGRFYTIFAVLLSVWLLRERFTKREGLFILIALFGTFLFIDKSGDTSGNFIGYIFAFMYTFFFALTNVFIKRTLSITKDANSILFTSNCITLLFVATYFLWVEQNDNSQFQISGMLIILLSSFLSGFLGTLLFYEALKYLRFSTANVSRAFSPILLAIISYPFFPVALHFQNIFGAGLILVSVFLLVSSDRKST